MALLQLRKTQLLKSADKKWTGYFIWETVLSGASLGTTPGVQTSRRMNRPALRLTYSFCLPSVNTRPQEDIKQP